MQRLRIAVAAGATALAFAARAELPPQYTRWADLQAIMSRDEIAHKLREPVERIEAQGGGAYRIQAGPCHLLVRVARKGQTQAGMPVAGPSVIGGVEVGEPVCE